ncbi:hypothetical protein [Lancefieldella rimae]|uniref:hypothetical protein n=1 Tax=Lancefieldella rimae TaxID=1383 RepID=UPI001CB678C8|nr:hypothetical protein [Lancefieldella rimae]MBF4803742.1 hypothetical protein [Lancefieldella rimae]
MSNGDKPRDKFRQVGLELLERFRSFGNSDYRLYLTVMFKTYVEHREDFLAIHRQGQSWMLRDAIEEAFGFSEMVAHATQGQQFKVSYHIGGIFNNMMLWFEHNMEETPEEMVKIAMSYRPVGAMMFLYARS